MILLFDHKPRFGPGGKQIRAIVEQPGVEIDISDDGTEGILRESIYEELRP